MTTVTEAVSVDEELLEGLARLIPQLSSSATAVGRAELAEMVEESGTHLLVARDQDAVIIGVLTLVVFRIPTGIRAWIEDVVVDQTARGRGVGEALARDALRIAVGSGAKTVDLTSRPIRRSANRLYERLGFEVRDTNVYRLELE
ncbi:MAG TPA: GNAT family N-acetyltransferase [Acidimicrobiales bacterium]|nr:GNAT family N-acetyltransferase [Acidimicrobiales bacterium]